MPSQEQSRPQRRDDTRKRRPRPRWPRLRQRRRVRTLSTTTSTASGRDRWCSRSQRRGVRARFSGKRAASEPRRGRRRTPASRVYDDRLLIVHRVHRCTAPLSCCHRGARCRWAPHLRHRVARRSCRSPMPVASSLAGDRRATMGNLIANRDLDKVFGADEYSAVGIAGTAGRHRDREAVPGRARALREDRGTLLSPEGKADRLATMIRANLPMAMQGLSVVPMFAGFDLPTMWVAGSSPMTCPAAATRSMTTTASARGRCLPRCMKLWQPGMDSAAAIRVAVESLYDAADDDSATGGPDLSRRIWPTLAVVNVEGLRFLGDDALCRGCRQADRADRRGNPGGAR